MRWSKIIALILLVVILGLGGIYIMSTQPKDANTNTKVDFVVKSGQSTKDVSESLFKENIIRNSFAFYLYTKMIRGSIVPGTYELSASQSASDIANMLTQGKYKIAKVTIIEGWRVTQMTDYFKKEKITNLTDFTDKATQYEGYLFPDTYEVRVDITTDDMIKLMRDNFDKRTQDLKPTKEQIILASIVEREAQSDEERPMIAGIYLNRINKGMKMQADPTVQYAKGDWTAPTLEEYESVISPYNTYLHEGWPPGPICNPGLKSIQAAINPTTSDYFFFFHAQGKIFYSKTAAEHEAKVRQYF